MQLIQNLQKPDHLYHATLLWKLEYILEDGLRVDCSHHKLEGRPYQCLSDSIRIAIDMARITNEAALHEIAHSALAVIGVDLGKLTPSVRLQLQPDPKLRGGVITYQDIPSHCIDQVLVAHFYNAPPDLVVQQLCERSPSPINLSSVQYFAADGKYVLLG